MTRVIVISGRSGSGKTICLHALEDLGYYCVDNLPVLLLPELVMQLKERCDYIAVGIDARNTPEQLQQFEHIFQSFQNNHIRCEVLYVDATNDVLLKRFSDTRRKHPLSTTHISLSEALDLETHMLSSIAHHADVRIDTSVLKTPELRNLVIQRLQPSQPETPTCAILIQSFGYKYGLPYDADFVFDCRCLPNPYWKEPLAKLTGQDPAVKDFLIQHPKTSELLHDIQQFLDRWIIEFTQQQRNYLNIAFGCTGGQHRSVFIAESVFGQYLNPYPSIQLRHRELGLHS